MRYRIARRLRDHDWVGALIDLVIVVAGILIALQLNNWNQDRIDAKRKHAYLGRIVVDLDTDLRVNGNRERFLTQVRRYGEHALAHAETGALVEGSAWKTVLAYFQAGQFYAYSRESNAFDEMRDAGDLGLIGEPHAASWQAIAIPGTGPRATVLAVQPAYCRTDLSGGQAGRAPAQVATGSGIASLTWWTDNPLIVQEQSNGR